MIDEFKKQICSNCKGKCTQGIVVIENNGLKSLKCFDYEKKQDFEGYKNPQGRTAKQRRSIMGFRQEY